LAAPVKATGELVGVNTAPVVWVASVAVMVLHVVHIGLFAAPAAMVEVATLAVQVVQCSV